MTAVNRSPTRPRGEILAAQDTHLAQQRPGSEQPRFDRLVVGQTLFSDENLDRFSHLLDDCFRVPGTPVRFGLYGIIGFIPGIGDVLGGLASCFLLVAGWFRGVPYVTLARMVANVGIEVAVGAVPFFGNLFDIAWKANRRNYSLLMLHLAQPERHTWKDWAFLIVLVLALGIVLLAPLVLIIVLLSRVRITY